MSTPLFAHLTPGPGGIFVTPSMVCVCVCMCAASTPMTWLVARPRARRIWIVCGSAVDDDVMVTPEWSVSCLRRPPYVQSESLKMQDHGYSADNIEYM